MKKTIFIILSAIVVAISLLLCYIQPNRIIEDKITYATSMHPLLVLKPELLTGLIVLCIITSLISLKLQHPLATLLIPIGLLYPLFLVNYPNVLPDVIWGHNVDVATLLMQHHLTPSNVDITNLCWPASILTSTVLYLVTDFPLGTLPATLNIIFALIEIMVISIVLYSISRKVMNNNALVTLCMLFAWGFFVYKSIIYEFGYHHQWISITLYLLFMWLSISKNSKQAGIKNRVILQIILFSAVTITHFISSLAILLLLLFQTFFSHLGHRSDDNACLKSVEPLAPSSVILLSWYVYNTYRFPAFNELLKRLLKGELLTREYVSAVVSSPSDLLYMFPSTIYKGTLISFCGLTLLYVLLQWRKGEITPSERVLLSSFVSLLFLGLISIGITTSWGWRQRWLWQLIMVLPITTMLAIQKASKMFRKRYLNALRFLASLLVMSSFISLFNMNFLPWYNPYGYFSQAANFLQNEKEHKQSNFYLDYSNGILSYTFTTAALTENSLKCLQGDSLIRSMLYGSDLLYLLRHSTYIFYTPALIYISFNYGNLSTFYSLLQNEGMFEKVYDNNFISTYFRGD